MKHANQSGKERRLNQSADNIETLVYFERYDVEATGARRMRNPFFDPEAHVQEGRVILLRVVQDSAETGRDMACSSQISVIFPLLNGDQSRFAPPQLVLPLAAFQTPTTVFALVHAGAAALLSVGAAAALP